MKKNFSNCQTVDSASIILKLASNQDTTVTTQCSIIRISRAFSSRKLHGVDASLSAQHTRTLRLKLCWLTPVRHKCWMRKIPSPTCVRVYKEKTFVKCLFSFKCVTPTTQKGSSSSNTSLSTRLFSKHFQSVSTHKENGALVVYTRERYMEHLRNKKREKKKNRCSSMLHYTYKLGQRVYVLS